MNGRQGAGNRSSAGGVTRYGVYSLRVWSSSQGLASPLLCILTSLGICARAFASLRSHHIFGAQGKARPMTTHLELLRTIVTHTVHEPPPEKFLVGEEANRWARVFAFSRVKPSGERIGVRRDGVAAAVKLARSLAKENPRYHRGARHRTLTEAILNVSMEKFPPGSIVAAEDLAALKTAVQEWFSKNAVPRSYFVPCWLMPDLMGFPNARPFTIGPVAFCHLSDFLKARYSTNPVGRALEEINYEPLLRAMRERHATWIAERWKSTGARRRRRRRLLTLPSISRSWAFNLRSLIITRAPWLA